MSINEFEQFFEESSSNNLDFNPEIPDSAEPRCPVVLILDTSGSMKGEPINELNAGIETFKREIDKNELASNRVEVAIITFGGETPKLVQDFITMDDFKPITLSADGRTPMGQAINMALKELEERKNYYNTNGLRYYRPWLFLISDGEPTHNWSEIPKKIQQATDNKKLIFYAVGVNKAKMNILRQIAPNNSYKLKGLDFQKLFQWLSSSMTRVSTNKIGEQDDDLPLVNFNE